MQSDRLSDAVLMWVYPLSEKECMISPFRESSSGQIMVKVDKEYTFEEYSVDIGCAPPVRTYKPTEKHLNLSLAK